MIFTDELAELEAVAGAVLLPRGNCSACACPVSDAVRITCSG